MNDERARGERDIRLARARERGSSSGEIQDMHCPRYAHEVVCLVTAIERR